LELNIELCQRDRPVLRPGWEESQLRRKHASCKEAMVTSSGRGRRRCRPNLGTDFSQKGNALRCQRVIRLLAPVDPAPFRSILPSLTIRARPVLLTKRDYVQRIHSAKKKKKKGEKKKKRKRKRKKKKKNQDLAHPVPTLQPARILLSRVCLLKREPGPLRGRRREKNL